MNLDDKKQLIASDPLLIQAIDETFAKHLAKRIPKLEEGKDDVLLGQEYRAYQSAKAVIVSALDELKSYKREQPKGKPFNKGR